MRKLTILICLAMLLCACAAETVSTERGGSVFGAFTTTDLSGEPLNEQVFCGHKLTMVNIWGTFCAPCVEEMPALAQLHTAYGDKFQVIGIVLDAADRNGNILPDKKAEAAAIIEATGAHYLQLLPSRSLNQAHLEKVQSVPETIFLDENGNQVGSRYFGAKTKAQWQQIIDTLLESME